MKRTLLVLNLTLGMLLAAPQKTPESMLGAAMHQEEVQGDVRGAVAAYKKVLATRGVDHKTAAAAMYHLGLCYQKLGDAEARKTFEKLIADYADQKELVAQARARLDGLAAAIATRGGPSVRRVIADTGRKTPWTVSFDGRLVSFRDSTLNVGVHNLETGEDRILTQYGDNAKGFAEGNAISRDGRQVALWHYMNGAKDGELRVVGTDGKGERTVYRGQGEWGIPTDWSPDGKYILVQLERGKANSLSEGDTDFAMISAADGTVRVLKTAHYTARYRPRIVFSPDGHYVAFDYPAADNPRGDVFVLPVNGGAENAVAHYASRNVLWGWSPDGKRVVFASDRSGNLDLWTVPVDGAKQTGEPEVLKANCGADTIGITKTGAIYYASAASRSNIEVVEMDTQTGRLLGQPSRPVHGMPDITQYPAWSPDGKRLAYRIEGSDSISILAVGSGEVRQVTPQTKVDGLVRWSVDGNSLFLGAQRTAVRISVPNGETVSLGDSGFVSLDGRHGYLSIRKDGTHKIVRHDVVSGEERVLFTGPDVSRVMVSLSPDGSQLAFMCKPDKLCLMPSVGGEPRELFQAREGVSLPWRPREVTWTPDGKRILFVSIPSGTDAAVWIVPVDGGPAIKTGLETHSGSIWALSFHPDGKHLAYTLDQSASELWVLENFLSARDRH